MTRIPGFIVVSLSAAVLLLPGCGGSPPPIGALSETPQQLVSQSTEKSLPYHHTFKYSGTEQTFKVPDGVTSITVVARGAAGAGIGEYGNLSGFGGRVYAVIPVTPRERLHIYVGGAGVDYGPRGYGGFNGGGNLFCCGGLAGGGAGGDGGGATGGSGGNGTQRGSSDGNGGYGVRHGLQNRPVIPTLILSSGR